MEETRKRDKEELEERKRLSDLERQRKMAKERDHRDALHALRISNTVAVKEARNRKLMEEKLAIEHQMNESSRFLSSTALCKEEKKKEDTEVMRRLSLSLTEAKSLVHGRPVIGKLFYIYYVIMFQTFLSSILSSYLHYSYSSYGVYHYFSHFFRWWEGTYLSHSS